MGLGNIGWSGMVLILVALLVVFGPSKLPEIGKAFGKSLLEFKSATKGIVQDTIVEDSAQTETSVQTGTSVSTAMQSPVQTVVPIPVLQQSDAPVSDQ